MIYCMLALADAYMRVHDDAMAEQCYSVALDAIERDYGRVRSHTEGLGHTAPHAGLHAGVNIACMRVRVQCNVRTADVGTWGHAVHSRHYSRHHSPHHSRHVGACGSFESAIAGVGAAPFLNDARG